MAFRPICAQEIQPNYLMLTDPAFELAQPQMALPEGAIRLWRETLSRPEPDLIKVSADSIAVAHTEGFAGLTDCVPELLAALKSVDLNSEAAYAICRALIVLDAHGSADDLFATSQHKGTEFRQRIEPVLAEWDFPPIRGEWRNRLEEKSTPRRELLLACAGVGHVKDELALPLLLEMVQSPTRPGDVRLAAARAAGQIAASGLEPDALRLTEKPKRSLIDDLCALSLIRNHTSPAAQELFLAMAVHKNPTVAAPALRAMLKIDAAQILPLAEQSLKNQDAKVRECGLDAYIALPTVERIALIADVMDDPHPDVRASARIALHRFSEQDTYDTAVREAGMTVLARDDWRGQEQASLLLAALDHEPAASRLIELLESERQEVMITAAWGLRMLAAAGTEDGILDRARRVTEHMLSTPREGRQPGSDPQLAHLFDALVVLDDSRAEAVMRRHVPKDVYREKSRAAAVWGLGHLLEDQPDPALAADLMQRLTDIESVPAELILVRQMSAISIGRMNAITQRDSLQTILGPSIALSSPIEQAIAWAIKRMDGELPPELAPHTTIRYGWPIEPVQQDSGM